jgi:hypothetical protein
MVYTTSVYRTLLAKSFAPGGRRGWWPFQNNPWQYTSHAIGYLAPAQPGDSIRNLLLLLLMWQEAMRRHARLLRRFCHYLRRRNGILQVLHGVSGQVNEIGILCLKVYIQIAHCWSCGCWRLLQSRMGGYSYQGNRKGPPNPTTTTLAPTIHDGCRDPSGR